MLGRVIGTGVAVIILATLVLFATSTFLTDVLWFNALGFGANFLNRIGWQWGVGLGSWLLLSLFLLVNLLITKPVIGHVLFRYPQISQVVKGKHITWLFLVLSLVLGMMAAAGTSTLYLEIASFFNQVPFGQSDPLFGMDIGFYLFSLPFYQIVASLLLGIVLFTLLLCGAIYVASGTLNIHGLNITLDKRPRVHLSLLGAAFFVIRALMYQLDIYQLVYSTQGGVFGAGFTDVHVNLLSNRVSMVIAFVVAIMLLIPRLFKLKLVAVAIGVWILAGILVGGIAPALVQNWIVEPNEFERERTYIDNHIEMTRLAYNLHNFASEEFPVGDELTWDDIENNIETINNVRLWDPRPLLQTYRQLQEMRLYYTFRDADVNRYRVDDELRQVMLSPRELDVSQIQNRTWINEHLQYTHGYGAVMSPVNEVTAQGLPAFWISDIPPRSVIDIEITEPRIYYGEMTNQYVIVNTRTEEFDYPMGDTNAFTRYQGTGGVEISNLWRRLALAVRVGSSRILLSTDITPESRALFDRNVVERARKIAPFLRYDNDPYMVVDEGRLYWIIDAYTISNRFPYAQPLSNWGNYVRNSVKVVIDAYNGDVQYYKTEPDPVVETYAKIFPDWLQPLENMSEGLRAQLRYPEDYFTVQARMYGTYHMTNTRVFYNREDVWTFAREVYQEREQEVLPYYVVMQLPGESESEMVLMLPFTPIRRNNMIAWLAARNDGDNYGEVLVYTFPKDRLTQGPAQIEARIDQDSEISQLLTLWGQRGSQVVRGNLLVLPIGEGLLYVEPVYLMSEQSGMPQLQRVIVAHGDDIVMADSILTGLEVIFGERDEPIEQMIDDPFSDMPLIQREGLPEEAYDLYQEAQERLTAGDFAGFGKAWERLEEVLLDLLRE